MLRAKRSSGSTWSARGATRRLLDRERAALEWTEAVTNVGETEVPDSVFERVRQHFDEAGLVALTFAVVAINSWNRLAVAFRADVGDVPAAERCTCVIALHI